VVTTAEAQEVNVIYLSACAGCFRVRFVLGERAVAAADQSSLSKSALTLPDKQAAEKLRNSAQLTENAPPGLKAPVDFIGVMRGLKPPPPSGSSFSAACKASRHAEGIGLRLIVIGTKDLASIRKLTIIKLAN
jgi:hypothetical protein